MPNRITDSVQVPIRKGADDRFGLTEQLRVAPAPKVRLVNIMDADVLEALPPYNALLGGKLVASLIRSRDIYDDFARAYGKSKSVVLDPNEVGRLLVAGQPTARSTTS